MLTARVIKIGTFGLDSTMVGKLDPDGTGALNRNVPQSIGKSRGGCGTKIHMADADARTSITFVLSAGEADDAPAGRKLLRDTQSPMAHPWLWLARTSRRNRRQAGSERRCGGASHGAVESMRGIDRATYKRRNGSSDFPARKDAGAS